MPAIYRIFWPRQRLFSAAAESSKYVLRLFSFQFIFTTQNLGLHSMCLTRISAKRRGSAYIIAFQLGLVTCNVMRVLVWMHLRPSPLLRHVSASLMSSRLVWMDPRDVVVNSASLAGVCSLIGEKASEKQSQKMACWPSRTERVNCGKGAACQRSHRLPA